MGDVQADLASDGAKVKDELKVNQLERALRELVLMALSLPDDDMHAPVRIIAREGQRVLTWIEQAPAREDEKNSPGNPLES